MAVIRSQLSLAVAITLAICILLTGNSHCNPIDVPDHPADTSAEEPSRQDGVQDGIKARPGGETSTPVTSTSIAPEQPVCVRRELFRALLKLSGFEKLIEKIRSILDLTDEELEALCKELCGMGVCPPGCPGNMVPPWGDSR